MAGAATRFGRGSERGDAAPSTPSTPVVVLLGGPSAEHDVSIVSGNAIADALATRAIPSSAVLIDLDGGWWRLPAGPSRGTAAPGRLRRPGGARRDRPGAGRGRRSTGWPRRDPPPVVFIALHGPFGEDGTVQAILEAAGLAYTGVGRHGLGAGHGQGDLQAPGRGLGLPVVDWREVTAPRWAADRDGVLGELEAFAAGTGDPRLMVKPARLGSSVGMTLAHDAGGAGRPRSSPRSATTAWPSSSATSPARATSRSR